MPSEVKEWTQMEISVEMDLDVTMLQREYYDLLECMADIGGILQILLSGIAFILVILNYQHMDNFLAAQLFKIDSSGSDNDN